MEHGWSSSAPTLLSNPKQGCRKRPSGGIHRATHAPTRVCVATEAVAAGAGELHGSFAYLPGRRPLEFGFAPCRAFSAWRQLPHPHQVEGDGGEGELCGYFSKPAHPESPHPSLLFQDAEDRLDHRFSSSVQRSPGGGIQLFSESPMRRVIRVIHRLLQLPTAMQSTSHVAIRDIRVDAAFLHDLEVVQREKAAVRTHLSRRRTALALHAVHHGYQQSVVVHFPADLLRGARIIIAHRLRRGV